MSKTFIVEVSTTFVNTFTIEGDTEEEALDALSDIIGEPEAYHPEDFVSASVDVVDA